MGFLYNIKDVVLCVFQQALSQVASAQELLGRNQELVEGHLLALRNAQVVVEDRITTPAAGEGACRSAGIPGLVLEMAKATESTRTAAVHAIMRLIARKPSGNSTVDRVHLARERAVLWQRCPIYTRQFLQYLYRLRKKLFRTW